MFVLSVGSVADPAVHGGQQLQHIPIQGNQLNMVVGFWYLVKSDLYSVQYRTLDKSFSLSILKIRTFILKKNAILFIPAHGSIRAESYVKEFGQSHFSGHHTF